MRLIFMGTSYFAVPSLQAVLEAGHEVAGVWTRIDKPHGRGHHLEPSPVKAAAAAAGLRIVQPRTLRTPEATAELAALEPEVICVASYGLILPPEVLQIPRLGCINVHASLLPQYRGAAPIHRAIMAGQTVTGITTMKMDEGLDTGDMLLKVEEPIGPDDTYGALHDRLSRVGASLLVETLQLLAAGACPSAKQDPAAATYAPPVKKEECQIDWSRPAAEVHNQVRGTEPRPGSFTFRRGEQLRIHSTRVGPGVPGSHPAAAFAPDKRRLLVSCGEGSVELLVLQPAGKKTMAAADYLRGYPLVPGERLG